MDDNKHKYGFFCTLQIENYSDTSAEDKDKIFNLIHDSLQKEGFDVSGNVGITVYEIPVNKGTKKVEKYLLITLLRRGKNITRTSKTPGNIER